MLGRFNELYYLWDKANAKTPPAMHLNASDEGGRKLVVKVMDGVEELDLTGADLSLYWESAGGQYEGLDTFSRGQAGDGHFELTFTTGMLSQAGKVTGNLRLQTPDETIISPQFTFIINRGINTSAIESDNSFTTLTEQMGRIVRVEASEPRRERNEDERIANEESRIAQEANRQSQFNQKQQEREDSYQIAEDNRDQRYENAESRRERSYQQMETELYGRGESKLEGIHAELEDLQIETGSNSKGSWIKRADGTMECVVNVTIKGTNMEQYGSAYYKYASPRTIEFPQRFDGFPTIQVGHDRYNWFFAWSRLSATHVGDLVGYRFFDVSDKDTTNVKIRATGYWNEGIAMSASFSSAKKDTYPSYWNYNVERAVDRALELEAANNQTFSFGFITDMHMGTNAGRSGKLMTDVVKKMDLDVVINGGDQLSNGRSSTKSEMLPQFKQMFDGFETIIDKVYNVMGNHDDNSISRLWKETFKHNELYTHLFEYLNNRVTYGPSKKYYYKDDTARKVRYIVLDSSDIPYIKSGDSMKYLPIHEFAYRQDQLNWLANEALKTPSNQDWSVVMISHAPPHKPGVRGNTGKERNADMARKIVEAYKNRSTYSGQSDSSVESEFQATVKADFTSNGGEVIAWLSGHVHFDNIVMAPEGFPIITTLNDNTKTWEDQAPRRPIGTTNEHAFDIVTVDRLNRRINLTRVGAGTDRSVSY